MPSALQSETMWGPMHVSDSAKSVLAPSSEQERHDARSTRFFLVSFTAALSSELVRCCEPSRMRWPASRASCTVKRWISAKSSSSADILAVLCTASTSVQREVRLSGVDPKVERRRERSTRIRSARSPRRAE